jgi:hypothetical protein
MLISVIDGVGMIQLLPRAASCIIRLWRLVLLWESISHTAQSSCHNLLLAVPIQHYHRYHRVRSGGNSHCYTQLGNHSMFVNERGSEKLSGLVGATW